MEASNWNQNARLLGKIEMTLYVAAYYKPRDGDSQSTAEFRRSLELAYAF